MRRVISPDVENRMQVEIKPLLSFLLDRIKSDSGPAPSLQMLLEKIEPLVPMKSSQAEEKSSQWVASSSQLSHFHQDL